VLPSFTEGALVGVSLFHPLPFLIPLLSLTYSCVLLADDPIRMVRRKLKEPREAQSSEKNDT